MKEKKCEKCDAIMINIGAIHICPNCYDVEVEDEKWEGHKHTCPKCGKDIKLFQTHHKGKVFHCKHCNTVGHVINQKEYHKKTYNISKASQLGKKLTWLFDVPCKFWFRKDDVYETICPKCNMKKVCDEHSKALYEFTKRKDIEVYFAGDFIEIVHKKAGV
ncbi:hypothetical protein J4434_08630 [Candidatus Woesearchaeota archaeon]|nr:hypothetical protein [Candidatus Woesearchaeota archaeon]